MPKTIKRSESKEKIGTILDKEVVRIIKERSFKEGKTISDVIQEAVLQYNESNTAKTAIRLMAVKRFCSKPFNLELDELNDLLNEDQYDV